MLKDFLKEVQAVSEFEAEIFNGQLIIKGRILSPAEIEKASLANSLLLQGLSSTGEISQFQKMSEQLQDDPDEETLQQAYSMLSKILRKDRDHEEVLAPIRAAATSLWKTS